MADFSMLDDHKYFLTWDELPDEADYGGEALEYCFLAEIQHCDGFGRYRCIVEDREGSECVVAFYPSSSTTFFPDSNEDGFDFKKLKRGHTLAIIGALQHEFLDETMGVRVEDMKSVSVSTVDQVEDYLTDGEADLREGHPCQPAGTAGTRPRGGGILGGRARHTVEVSRL